MSVNKSSRAGLSAPALFDTLTSHDREHLRRILGSLVADAEDPRTRGRRS
jgi:hypothetical protein